MAATNAVLTLVKAGQRVVVSDNVYGGTHRLFTKILAHTASSSRSSTRATPRAFDAGGRPTSTCSGSRRPTNPLMKVCDIAALAAVAHRRGAILVVDNTFMSPFFQRPARPRAPTSSCTRPRSS